MRFYSLLPLLLLPRLARSNGHVRRAVFHVASVGERGGDIRRLVRSRRHRLYGRIQMIILSIMLLQLVAVFSDSHLDADAYVVPADQCDTLAPVLAHDWQMRAPDIVAVAAWCEEKDDPRERLKEYQESHPDVNKSKMPDINKSKPHVPKDDEA